MFVIGIRTPPPITAFVVVQDILAYNCEESADDSLPFPIIADSKRELAVALGMLDPVEKDKDGVPLTARCVSLSAASFLFCHVSATQTLQSVLTPTAHRSSLQKVFIVGPDKRLKLSILYPATTGRNFDEILRVLDSLQLTARLRVATPADWKVRNNKMMLSRGAAAAAAAGDLVTVLVLPLSLQPGDCVMVPPSMPEEEAAALFPEGVYTKELPSGRKYLRYTPQQ